MSRPFRVDHPGALHHVTNRGHGHRLLFNGAADVAVFLGLLQRAAAERGLEVHAYCVMGTHFHLLVGTRDGNLSAVLGWVEDLYARYFNRTRERDGHVMKARFCSRIVDDIAYLIVVIVYIDRNPVAAGIVDHPGAYPHSSVRAYLGQATVPWLRRDVVEGAVCRVAGASPYRPDLYPSLWRACYGDASDSVVAAAVEHPRVQVAPIGSLLRAGPEHVQQWLRDLALQEEGAKGVALALPPTSAEVAAAECIAALRENGLEEGAARGVRAGLLHVLAGETISAIAARLAVSRTRAGVAVAAHRAAMRLDPRYASAVAGCVANALRRTYGGLVA